MFHAIPNLNAEDVDNVAGSYINCYIQAESIKKAEWISRVYIRKMNWNILDCEEAYELDSDTVSDEGREYYEQALIEKTVYVFHNYPID